MTKGTSIDPVIVARAKVDAALDAIDASGPRTSAALERRLAKAWANLHETPPATAEGAAILVREAESYEGDLARGPLPMVVTLPGYLGRAANRIETGRVSGQDKGVIRVFLTAAMQGYGPSHPIAKTLGNVADFVGVQ